MRDLIKTLAVISVIILICGLIGWSIITKPAIAQVKTITVDKVSTRLASSNDSGQGKYSITLSCSLDVDGTPEYLFNISVDYLMGDSVSSVYQKFEDKMQDVIDKYVAEQVIYNHTQLDSVVSTLETNLSW